MTPPADVQTLQERLKPLAVAATEDGSIAINVPAPGIFRGTFGLGIFGPLMLLVPVFILFRSGVGWSGLSLGVQLWLIFLAAVALAMILVSQDWGRAAARFTLDPAGAVRVLRGGLWTRRRSYAAGELAAEVTEAPITASNKALHRLTLTRPQGTAKPRPWHLLMGRPEPLLERLAATLRDHNQHPQAAIPA
jgi:hypothetical protein